MSNGAGHICELSAVPCRVGVGGAAYRCVVGSERRWTVDELIEATWRSGYVVTATQQQRWRTEGLLPRPERTIHKGAKGIWTYSDASRHQLLALARLRDKDSSPTAIAIGLALEGFSIDVEVVRAAVLHQLGTVTAELDDALAWATAESPGEDPVTVIAGYLARMRKGRVLRWRVAPLIERQAAFELMLRLFLSGDHAPTPDDFVRCLPAFERLTMLDRARRDRLLDQAPWLEGDALEGFSAVSSLPVITARTRSASEEDARLAIDLARTFTALIGPAARMIEAVTGKDHAGGLTLLRETRTDTAVSQAVFLGAFFSFVQSPLRQNAIDINDALVPLAGVQRDAARLVALGQQELRRRLESVNDMTRRAVERYLAFGPL